MAGRDRREIPREDESVRVTQNIHLSISDSQDLCIPVYKFEAEKSHKHNGMAVDISGTRKAEDW